MVFIVNTKTPTDYNVTMQFAIYTVPKGDNQTSVASAETQNCLYFIFSLKVGIEKNPMFMTGPM